MFATIVLFIPGMACGGCVSTIETELGTLAEVEQVSVDLDAKTVQVQGNVAVSQLISTLGSVGYAAELVD